MKNCAVAVCSAVLCVGVVVPFPPRFLTSSYSFLYAPLPILVGPFVRNCDSLFITNGSTRRTQAFGSLMLAGGVGRQSPTPEPTVKAIHGV